MCQCCVCFFSAAKWLKYQRLQVWPLNWPIFDVSAEWKLCFLPHSSSLIMYLENKSNLEMEMSQTSAQGHQARNSLRSPEAVAGNFGELRLLQGISESRDTQKLQQSAVLPAGQCVIHTEGFVPVRQEDGYDYWTCFCSRSVVYWQVS